MKEKGVLNKIFCGALIGGVNGLFGGGGGMIAVPLLSGAMGYKRKEAHATAIAIIAPVCAVSAFIYALFGFVELAVVIPASIGNVAGGLLGAKLLGKLPEAVVESVFIAVMLAAGIRLLL